ncbi:hypothetical protein K2173_006800 [Erythroxylum novogranatense]|uniref:Uncharacterized protein n=1 Tax=Erythroxylum novogranatense TaxID=1862640 RepID=A0AAV8SXT1_9ROSI|nr:hypothetical protein K2173_006800 [Erythroxylum novogranatense]
MIKGYSKIDPNCRRTRLVDFLDQTSPPHSPISFQTLGPDHQSQDMKQVNICSRDRDTQVHESFLEHEHDQNLKDEDEETFLHRSQSSSSVDHGTVVTRSYSMRVDNQNSTLRSRVRRAFSFRSSACVSDDYRRIAEQYNNISDEENLLSPQAGYEKKKAGNIFEACRRFFGF